MRNVKLTPLTDKSVLQQPMTLLTADAKAAGGVEGSGSHAGRRAHQRQQSDDLPLPEHQTSRCWPRRTISSRSGHKFRAGAFIIPNADRATLEPQFKELGLSAWAVASAPSVKTHELNIPRIGYVHSWSRTQDEGWVRAALDYYGVPYTYFADKKLREGNLRAKYDVIIFPHAGGNAQSIAGGRPQAGQARFPTRRPR